jgi:hypothetical protein
LLRGTCGTAGIILSLRAIGTFKIDNRWRNKINPDVLFEKIPLSEHISTEDSNFTAYNIFHTSIIRLPLEHMQQLHEGLFIQFNIPKDILPTFKGLHGIISYNLVVTAQHIGINKEQVFYFPFKCSGKGYQYSSLQCEHSDMCISPKASLPEDHVFTRIDDFSFLDEVMAATTMYSIRDEKHVCNISFSSPVFQEDFFVLVFDFASCEQRCSSVRVKFISTELKRDGDVLHVRTVVYN